jgi:frataxin
MLRHFACRPVRCQRLLPALCSAAQFANARRFTKLTDATRYHALAGAFIEEASILGDSVLDRFSTVDDSTVSDDVLSIKTTRGTFVLNKQAPVQQLWYSSPVSGPHHYDYDSDTRRWLSDKDRHDLQLAIERELSLVCGEEVSFGKPPGAG